MSKWSLDSCQRDCERTCMTNTGVVDLDAHFVCLWWCYLDIFNCEVLAGFPGNCGLVNCQQLDRNETSSISAKSSELFSNCRSSTNPCKTTQCLALCLAVPHCTPTPVLSVPLDIARTCNCKAPKVLLHICTYLAGNGLHTKKSAQARRRHSQKLHIAQVNIPFQ